MLASGTTKIEQASIRSFKDCPYKCTNGYIIDPYQHSKRECPHCAQLRRELVRGTAVTDKPIQKVLNLPPSYMGGRLDMNMLWPKSELKLLDKESIKSVCEFLNDLYVRVAGAGLVDHSVLINLGRHAHTSSFAHPFLLQAYKGSLMTAPYVSDYDVKLLFSDKASTIEDLEMDTLLGADVCLVNILASATLDSILACKGLMQLRAKSDKVTLFLTDYFGPHLVGLQSDEKSKDLAYMLSVKYVVQEQQEFRRDTLQVSNEVSEERFNNWMNGI